MRTSYWSQLKAQECGVKPQRGKNLGSVLGKWMSGGEEGPAHPPAPPRAPAQILSAPTLPLAALGLIFAVLAVVLLVTGPGHGDAPPTRAGKVVGWTFGFPPTYFVTETSVRRMSQPHPASSQPRTEGFLPKTPLRSHIPDPCSTICAGATQRTTIPVGKQSIHSPRRPKGASLSPEPLCPPALTGAVALVRVIAAVVGAVAHPAGSIAQGGVLTLLERGALHPQLEVAAAVGGS